MHECPYCEISLSSADHQRCPRCGSEISSPESFQGPRTIPDNPVVTSRPIVRTQTRQERVIAESRNVKRMHPIRRPPMLKLCIVDDGQDDGEWVRVRTPRVVIGREEGEILISHDNAISGRHAEFVLEEDNGEYQWFIEDLGSRNGTFLRTVDTRLYNSQEIQLGCRLFRFETVRDRRHNSAGTGARGSVSDAEASAQPRGTMELPAVSTSRGPEFGAALVELISDSGEAERRYELEQDDNWIGTDAINTQVTLKDPHLDSHHARIYHDKHGHWRLESSKTLNGTWVRLRERHEILPGDEFFLGEQRLIVEVAVR